MYIYSDGLTIRNATADDAATLCSWWNDGRIMAHAGFPFGLGMTVEEVRADIAEDSETRRRHLMIEIDGVVCGEMNYRFIDAGRVASIGIKICDVTKQNRGYGTKLLIMLISELFDVLGCEKIVLYTNAINLRARHVYEKLGFQLVELRVNAWVDKVGEPQSLAFYELTRDNFIS